MLSAQQVSCHRQNRVLFHQLDFTVQPSEILQVEEYKWGGENHPFTHGGWAIKT